MVSTLDIKHSIDFTATTCNMSISLVPISKGNVISIVNGQFTPFNKHN